MESIVIVERESFDCDVCQKRFVRRRDLERHYVCHSDEKPYHILQRSYICDVCGKDFCNIKYLTRHRRIHTGEKRYECEVCQKKFSECGNLQKHRRLHTGYAPFACQYCDRKYTRKDQLQYHMIKHTNEKPLTCELCQKKFAFPRQLELHRLTHTNNKPFPCDKCGKTFLNRSTLKRHSYVHTGEKPYVCTVCSKGFSTTTNLKIHRATHIYKSSVTGNISQITFSKIHHPVRERPFECKECKQRFIYKSNLNRHMLIHGEKNFVCNVCEKRFCRKEDLKSHSLTHCIEKPYACDYCLKRFSDRKYLKIHMRFHMGVKPYQCDTCLYRFYTKGNLNKHKKTHSHRKAIDTLSPPRRFLPPKKYPIITESPVPEINFNFEAAAVNYLKLYKYIYKKGEKPYECQVCQKRFFSQRNLEKHEIEHANEKAFGLENSDENSSVSDLKKQPSGNQSEKTLNPDISPKEVSGSNYFKMYKSIYKGEKPHECKKCQKRFFSKSSLDKHELENACEIAISEASEGNSCLAGGITNTVPDSSEEIILIQECSPEQFADSDCFENRQSSPECKESEENSYKKSSPNESQFEHSVETAFIPETQEESSSAGDLKNQFPDSNFLQFSAREKAFECEICFKKFSYRHTLSKHLLIHNGYKPFSCSLCQERFFFKKDLRCHVALHQNKSPYTCDVCGKVCCRWTELKRHHRTHTGHRPYECDICHRRFGDSGNLRRHYVVHTGERPFPCNMCDKSFGRKSTLQAHLLTHASKKPFVCEYCEKGFTSPLLLEKHLNVHIGLKYECGVCKKQYAYINNLRFHSECIARNGGKPFTCEVCGVVYCIASSLKQHRKIHEKGPVTCNICQVELSSNKYLKIHLNMHKEKKPFMCNKCSRGFITRSNLKRHISMHRCEKSYACILCAKKFFTLSGLKTHKTYAHQPERSHVCTVCNRKFSCARYLEIHSRIHKSEMNFTCDRCQEKFSSQESLEGHLETHSLEKPEIVFQEVFRDKIPQRHLKAKTVKESCVDFTCDRCQEKFSSQESLEGHLETHSINKPKILFQEVCSDKIPQRHLKEKSVKEPCVDFTCDRCQEKFSSQESLEGHLETHSIDKPKIFFQEVCSDKIPQRHLKAKTVKESCVDFTYDRGQEKFSSQESLEGHLETRSIDKPKILFQEVCSDKIPQRHLKEKSVKEPCVDFTCDRCQEKFSNQESLEGHLEIHNIEKPKIVFQEVYSDKTLQRYLKAKTAKEPCVDFTCDNCQEKFSSQESLEEHLETHSIEKLEIVFQEVYSDKIPQSHLKAKTVKGPCVILIRNEIQDK